MASEVDLRPLELDFSSKIDYTKGFSSFHGSWSLKSAFCTLLNNGKNFRSNPFETAVKNQNGAMTSFRWYLAVEKIENWVRFKLHPVNLPVQTAVIFRLALCDENNYSIFNGSVHGVQFQYNYLTPPICVSFYMNSKSPVFGNDLIAHFWIDIPMDIQQQIPSSDLRNYGIGTLGYNTSHWKNFKDLSTNLFELFESVLDNSNESLSDVTLVIMENEIAQWKFYCHRYILASRSSVFKTMFANKQWKENAETNERTVEIKDINSSTMEMILRYLYTGCLFPKQYSDMGSLGCTDLLHIVNAAEKYFLDELKNYCEAHLIFRCDGDASRLQQLLVADQYRMPQLKAVCLASLSSHFKGNVDEEIPNELLRELLTATANRLIGTKEVSIFTVNPYIVAD